MINEVFADLIDDLPISSQVANRPLLPLVIEGYNLYATTNGHHTPVRYDQTVAEFKALFAMLPLREQIHLMAIYVGLEEHNVARAKEHSERNLKNRVVTFIFVIIGALVFAYIGLWIHSSVKGVPMKEDGFLGYLFNFVNELMRLF